MSDDKDDRRTDQDTFQEAVRRWGPFTVDVASSHDNTQCLKHYTKEDDGLSKSWAGEVVWCNPPYSDIRP